jgi:hypothetical protein
VNRSAGMQSPPAAEETEKRKKPGIKRKGKDNR